MGNSLNKMRSELVKDLLDRGWTEIPGKGMHTKMRSPGGKMVVIAHSSNSVRGFRNLLSTIRQIEREESQ